MAYHIYTTKGIVLSSYPAREADRVYSILTRDLGLIRARATGVRKEQSKLRGLLEPFSFSTVSLVKGKEAWRLTGALLEHRLEILFADRRDMLLAFTRVFSVVEKLIQGEEKHPEIYDVIYSTVQYILTSPQPLSLGKERGEGRGELIEIFLLLSILHELGYLSERPPALSELALEDIKKRKKELIIAINHGLQSSNLT